MELLKNTFYMALLALVLHQAACSLWPVSFPARRKWRNSRPNLVCNKPILIGEILQKAPQKYAVSIICVHNHPSGNPSPSIEDKTFTRDLAKAGKILNINVLDHIIIGDNKYFSFADEGMM